MRWCYIVLLVVCIVIELHRQPQGGKVACLAICAHTKPCGKIKMAFWNYQIDCPWALCLIRDLQAVRRIRCLSFITAVFFLWPVDIKRPSSHLILIWKLDGVESDLTLLYLPFSMLEYQQEESYHIVRYHYPTFALTHCMPRETHAQPCLCVIVTRINVFSVHYTYAVRF